MTYFEFFVWVLLIGMVFNAGWKLSDIIAEYIEDFFRK